MIIIADDKDEKEMFGCFRTDFQLPFLYPLFWTKIPLLTHCFEFMEWNNIICNVVQYKYQRKIKFNAKSCTCKAYTMAIPSVIQFVILGVLLYMVYAKVYTFEYT